MEAYAAERTFPIVGRATGRYLDALVEEAGVLKFRERIVVCDSSRIDTLLAIPL